MNFQNVLCIQNKLYFDKYSLIIVTYHCFNGHLFVYSKIYDGKHFILLYSYKKLKSSPTLSQNISASGDATAQHPVYSRITAKLYYVTCFRNLCQFIRIQCSAPILSYYSHAITTPFITHRLHTFNYMIKAKKLKINSDKF